MSSPDPRGWGVPGPEDGQYGIKIRFVGRQTDDVEVMDGSVPGRRFFAVYHDVDRRVTGALAFDQPRLVGMAKRWIGERMTLDDVQPALSVFPERGRRTGMTIESTWLSLLGAEVRSTLETYRGRVALAGSGDEALVLLHGQGGHLENFRHNIVALAQGRRVLAPDCVWHGLGPQPPFDPELIPAYVNQVRDLLSAAGIGRATFLGQSMGAWTALRLALDHPQLVSALVLVNPQGVYLPAEDGCAEVQPSPGPELAVRHVVALDEPSEANVRARLAGLFGDPTKLDDETVAIRRRLYSIPEVNDSLHRVLEAYMGGPGAPVHRHRVEEEHLRALACPTLLLWGAENMIPPVAGERMARVIPSATFRCAPGAGHWVHHEEPDWLHCHIEEFLASERPRPSQSQSSTGSTRTRH